MENNSLTVNTYKLDEEQVKPILENKPVSLIIAGAGSGKTLTLIGKIKYLLENHYVKPEEICCISFTNEAVKNLEKSIFKNCQIKLPCYTFHKLALKIISQKKTEFQIAPETLQEEIITRFFKEDYLKIPKLAKAVYAYLHIHGLNKKKKLKQKNLTPVHKQITIFLNQFKSNGYTQEDLKRFLTKSSSKNFLLIIYAISTLYETEKQIHGYLDFEDMIKTATEILDTTTNFLPYKLLLIDEFQDTSFIRFSFIQKIRAKTNADLCVVGDDYQSIYQFAGCDLSLFLQFKTYFPEATIYKLQTTYRNSQELITIAGNFIMKNPFQIPKQLQSNFHQKQPLKLVYIHQKKHVLPKILSQIPVNETVFILGRNHFDLKEYVDPKKSLNPNVRFLTIHASKGLEADHVILLNVENSKHGIPSKVKVEKQIHLIQKKPSFPDEEERRLFYVALTRAKKNVFLLIPKANPSKFIKELKKEKEVQIIHL